jgi:hypothetical protein
MNSFVRTVIRVLGLLSVFLALTAPLASTQAGESITQIGSSLQQKQAIIGQLKHRLARHKLMTADQIISDLDISSDHNRKLMAATHPQSNAFDKEIVAELDLLKTIRDRDVILAMETARIQEVMSSDNYLFYLAVVGGPALSWYTCSCGDPTTSLIFAIFLLPFDIVGLPVELIVSALTGF